MTIRMRVLAALLLALVGSGLSGCIWEDGGGHHHHSHNYGGGGGGGYHD